MLVRVIVEVADCPSLKVRKLGVAVMRKSGPVTFTRIEIDR
jgi:hypothetical protein